MALEFRIRDFAHPLSIVRLRRTFEQLQWATPAEMREYQARRVERVLDVAFSQVPYYRSLFERLGLRRRDVTTLADLARIPSLEKSVVAQSAESLVATGARSRNAVTTSGTGGVRMQLWMDADANALEFVRYWRHWSWAGYRLGDPFAEFSTVAFLRHRGLVGRQRFARRTLLNSAALTRETVRVLCATLRTDRPRFVKGIASVLYYFAVFARDSGCTVPRPAAVFSTGEMLRPSQRAVIEEVFDCKVYDSYGQMERVVAISECPRGRLHLESDYGLLDLDERAEGSARSMIGTGLHNLAMPLVRYRIGDLATLAPVDERCPCGRTLPIVSEIRGRESDAIRTPDGRVVTAPFLAFENVRGVCAGRLVRDGDSRIVAHVIADDAFDLGARDELVVRLRSWLGGAMEIEVEVTREANWGMPLGSKVVAVE